MRPLAVILCVAAGCAASRSEVKTARASAYDTEFARVWNVVTRLVTATYPRVVVDDANRGRLLTDWHLIQQKANPDLEGPGEQGQLMGGIFMRIGVRIEGQGGNPPWTVVIEAEAAEYKPGMTKIVPFQPGAIDEPPWVRGRVDNLYAKIHTELAAYAVPAPHTLPPTKPEVDASRWGSLPAALALVVAEVHAAAVAGDADGAASHMSDPFSSAIGTDAPRERTVILWKADPAPLQGLAGVLAAGCELDAGGKVATCPPGGATGKARFEERGGRWLLVAFGEE